MALEPAFESERDCWLLSPSEPPPDRIDESSDPRPPVPLEERDGSSVFGPDSSFASVTQGSGAACWVGKLQLDRVLQCQVLLLLNVFKQSF